MQSAKTKPGANCGLDHQILIAKFRVKLKKTRKNTRPIRYELNQILYEFTVEVMNKFKGLNLVSSVPEELWTEVCNREPFQWKRKASRQNGYLRRLYKCWKNEDN